MSNRSLRGVAGRTELKRGCARAAAAGRWREGGGEPPLAEVLADPMVALVMRRDGVSAAGLRAVVTAAQARLRRLPCPGCAR